MNNKLSKLLNQKKYKLNKKQINQKKKFKKENKNLLK
jgi:hypothetical protein